MICYVCDKDSWHPVMVQQGDRRVPIHTQSKVQVCKECGNACHEVDPKREEQVREYYRKEYRPAPNISNLITTTHKQNYISAFLSEFLRERKGTRMKIADVGCATGYLLGFFKRMGHLVTGCEYTIPYRRMAEHYYGVPVTEELETKHRYDLITIYHVLEHMIEPDKKLIHYASLLAEGGRILVSTPEWFGDLEENSGGPIKSFDHLYHKDHINLFSRTSLRNLFRKCGLWVEKEEYRQYGQTYFLRKAKEGEIPANWMIKENWVEVEREMLKDKKAIELHLAGNYKDAIEVKTRFPEAWLGMALAKAAKDPGRQAELFAEAEKAMPDNIRLRAAKSQWLYQQGKLAEALVEMGRIVEFRPNEDMFMYMGFACSQLGRIPEAVGYFETAMAMDPRKWQECQNWILKLVCSLPAWDERALAEAKEVLLGNALSRGDLKVELKEVLSGIEDEKAPAKAN